MKHYKKYKLWRWDDLYVNIYNVNIDIVVYEDFDLLKDWWSYEDDCGCVQLDDHGDPAGLCVPIKGGDFVVLLKKESLQIDTIVHEIVHVRQFLFEGIGMYEDQQPFVPHCLKESEAYFTGAIVMEVVNRVREHMDNTEFWITKVKRI